MKDEEMAEEWVKENMDCVKTVSCLNHDCNYFSDEERSIAKSAFKDGYNKANEWHYVKDGDLPKDNRYILIATRTDVYRGFYENNNWYGDKGGRLRCIAWKELPELPKEIKE